VETKISCTETTKAKASAITSQRKKEATNSQQNKNLINFLNYFSVESTQVEPLNSKMAPSKTAKSRQGIKLNIANAVKAIATYESQLMTQKKADELDGLRSRLKNYFEKYTADSTQIQQELDDADAPQEDYDKMKPKLSGWRKKRLELPR
jgi:hypothetical protein